MRTLSTGDVREKIRALQTLQDACDAAKATLLAELDASKDFEVDGSSTVNAWVRSQLRMDAGAAGVLMRSYTALRDLPLVAQAAAEGRLGLSI